MFEKLWRTAKQPLSRRRLLQIAAAFTGVGLGAKWLLDQRVEVGSVLDMSSHGGNWAPASGNVIDVREFKKNMTVEALNETAEHYFASVKNWDGPITKPLASIEGAPALLNNFAHVMNGLNLLPGMRVLDFGAGTCWASRWLTQLGLEVIALDVSATALKMGQMLYARLPVIGERPAPRFLLFDGHRIDLPDASVDRILCLDTFHHLLNPDEVLREMSRILVPGGIAGFSEPGPAHSRSAQSQYEMRNFKVLEDDIDIHQIWAWAQAAGFMRIRIGVFAPHTYLLGLPEFDEYLEGGAPNAHFAETVRASMHNQRLFFLQKRGPLSVRDSRSRAGLAGKLGVNLESATVKEGTPLTARVVATNAGQAQWLPAAAKRGAVLFGCHLLDASSRMLDIDYFRHPLTPGDGRAIQSGESVQLDIRIPAPARGTYVLECDLLSEAVGWFAQFGSDPVRLKIDVI